MLTAIDQQGHNGQQIFASTKSCWLTKVDLHKDCKIIRKAKAPGV